MEMTDTLKDLQSIITLIIATSTMLGGLIGWFMKRAVLDSKTTSILEAHSKRIGDIENNCKQRASRDGESAVSSYKINQAMTQLEKITETFNESTQQLDTKISGITTLITESIKVAADAKTSASAAHKRLDDQQQILQNIQNNINDIKILLASSSIKKGAEKVHA